MNPNPWRAPTAFAAATLPVFLFLLPACAVPDAALSIAPQQIAATIATRADAATLQRALELADLTPLALPCPWSAAGVGDAGAGAYWRACAFVFAAEPVAARRRLSLAMLTAEQAGSPGPLGFELEQNGFSGAEQSTELAATFDLLGVLGVGRSAAAQVLAQAETREALGALEEALWSSQFRVERARLELAAAIAMEQAIGEMLTQAESGAHRAELLWQRGWLGELQVAPARAVLAELRTRGVDLTHEVARRRADLAEAAGLAIEAPALLQVTPAALFASDPHALGTDDPDDPALLERHPELRRLRLRYAVTEAMVRAAAALAWPEVAIGPRAILSADGLLAGGILDVNAAFPGTVRKQVALAVLERAQAREELEAALIRRKADLAAKAVRWRQDLQNERHHGPALAAATTASWGAAQARFLADPSGLTEWTMELERRREAVEEVLAHALHARIAALDLQEARGPDGIAPLDLAAAEDRP